MTKYCSGDWQCCGYARQDGSHITCAMKRYCEFQLPKDRGEEEELDKEEV